MGSGKNWRRNCQFSKKKMARKSDFWPNIDFFCGSNTHFFTSHLILLQKLTFFIGHFALQCREHGVPQNMALPKMGPIWLILAKNLIISLGDRISTNWAFMSLCLGWIVHIFTRICKFKLKISVVGTWARKSISVWAAIHLDFALWLLFPSFHALLLNSRLQKHFKSTVYIAWLSLNFKL